MKKTKLLSAALLTAAWLAGGSAFAQHEGDHTYNDKGICTIEGCTDKYQPATKTDGVYKLANVGNVEWMAAKVNAGATEPGDGGKAYAICSYELTSDIDYNNLGTNAHTPIGTYDKKFCGVFDGKGHIILNMKLNQPDRPKPGDDGIGFFGCVRVGNADLKNAAIRNLTIGDGCTVEGSSAYVGGLLGRIHQRNTGNTLLIENCVNNATVSTSANHVAGIVGQITSIGGATVTIQNCTNKGTITTTGGYAAGILAQINDAASATVNVKGCINEGAVSCSGLCAAGIVSQANNCAVALNIESCMNIAEVKSTGNKNCGGIFGANTSSKSTIHIVNCGNTGNVTGTTESAAFTGWIGSNSGQVITNCWNSGTVTGHSGASMYLYRDQNSSTTVTNIYDASGGGTQGTPVTSDDVSSGKLCYLLNGSTSTDVNWYQSLATDSADPYPMPKEKEGAIVYEVADYNCDGTPKGEITYSNTEGGSQDPHTFVNGICSVCGVSDDTYVSLGDDGYYHLYNAYQVEWFSVKVKEAKNAEIKAKLEDDINFEGIAHTPIGPNSGAKFFGEFDGQGHTISNLTMDSNDNAGFFLWVRGGSTIKNLIMDSSCSFHATNRAAAFVCVIQAAAGGAINIENCINKAAVSSQNLVSSAFVAACNWENTDQPAVNITNCWNAGNITHNGTDCAAALFGWNKGTCTIKGCFNTGTVSPLDSDNRNLVRSESGKTASIIDTYDLSATTGKTQGVKDDWTTETPISSGELCYYLNGDQSTIGWRQTIGTDTEPKLFGSSQQVYVQGYVDCTSSPVGDFTYGNTDETIQLGHNINADMGMCDVCYTQFQAPSLVDGYYELRNAGNVEWFGDYIDAGNLTSNAKLMNDIDFYNKENLHNPIGRSEQQKFNGTFDGQGYRIKNMIINRPTDNNIGFFGWLRGNNAPTTVKNLIIDASCTIHGYNRVGGVTGTYQNGGSVITIENVVNEATVTAENQDAGGFFGGHEGGDPTIIIRNCVNAGTITAKNAAPYAGALCCYLGRDDATSLIENFLNIGTINGHNGGNIGRHNISNVTNLIDLSATTDKTQGVVEGLASADVTNGKVAYIMGFKQLIGTDTYPSPLNEAEVKYIGEAGYSTFYDASNGYELNGDAKAYIGTINGSALHLDEIDDIPAGTAVVIGGTYYNKLAAVSTTADTEGNVLLGSDGTVIGGDGIYALAQKSGVVGFYPVASTVTIPAGKAYLEYTPSSGSGEVKGFTFVFDEDATSIQAINNGQQTTDGAIYNLAGQRLQKIQKGINIINGKKVLF